jgi:hypothetical protein
MKGKLKLMGKNHSDELETPEFAFDILKKFIPKNKIILEGFVGGGKLKRKMEREGFKVVSSDNFFNNKQEYDILISNPPFSIKDKILMRCYELNKPFALLLPITALEGIKRQELYKKYGIKILFPIKRIDFNGKKSPWFYTAWFTWGLNLPKELNFI